MDLKFIPFFPILKKKLHVGFLFKVLSKNYQLQRFSKTLNKKKTTKQTNKQNKTPSLTADSYRPSVPQICLIRNEKGRVKNVNFSNQTAKGTNKPQNARQVCINRDKRKDKELINCHKTHKQRLMQE